MLASDFPVVSVLVDQRHLDLIGPLVPAETPLLVVPASLVEQIVGFNFHRGVLACGRRKPNLDIESLIADRSRLTLVACPDVQDPENLGAIARISSSFGVDALLLGPHGCPPFSRRVLRVSMGAVWRLPVIESSNLARDLNCLQAHGIELIATVLDADAQPLDGFARPARMALLLGNEGLGLAQDIVQRCDRKVTIPMHPGADSLNVAVAAGIFLYHFCQSEP